MNAHSWDVRRQSDRDPDRIALASDLGTVTYGELEELARRYAAYLKEATSFGDVVAAVTEPGPHVFALILACQRTGRGVFPVLPRHRSLLDRDRLPSPPVDHVWTARPQDGSLAPLAGVQVDTVDESRSGFLVYRTSGTTGGGTVHRNTPRPGPHRGVLVSGRYGVGPGLGPRILANPTYHHGTLGPSLQALEAGNGLVLTRAEDAEDLVETLTTSRASSAILTVDQLVQLSTRVDTLPRTLQYVVHSGSPCPHAVKRVWAQRLSAGLVEYYGTSRGVATSVDGAEWLRHEGTVGRPVPGVRISIVDAHGEETVGRPGRVVVRHRHRAGTEMPGDVGVVDEDGYLYLAGRDADIGEGDDDVADAFHLESVVSRLPGAGAWYVGPDGQQARRVVVEVDSDDSARLVESELAGRADGILTVRPGTLPRTSTGKVDRQSTRRWFPHDEGEK
jgi:long-chain acyl-CoA synthetase